MREFRERESEEREGEMGNEKKTVPPPIYSHMRTGPVHLNRTGLIPFTEAHVFYTLLRPSLFLFQFLLPLIYFLHPQFLYFVFFFFHMQFYFLYFNSVFLLQLS